MSARTCRHRWLHLLFVLFSSAASSASSLFVLFASAASRASVASSASLCDAPGWEIGWRDEFDTFDASTWVKDVRGPGDSRTRDAAARAENVWVADGALVIEADAAWTGSAWTNLTAGAVRSTVGFRGPAPASRGGDDVREIATGETKSNHHRRTS